MMPSYDYHVIDGFRCGQMTPRSMATVAPTMAVTPGRVVARADIDDVGANDVQALHVEQDLALL